MINNHAIIVDDDDNTSSALSRIVRSHGYSVDTASSVDSARRHYANKRPGLMLVDVMLPDGNGVDLIEELQGDATVKFVVITGHASVEIAIQSLKAHVFDFLEKPFNLADIRKLLTKISELNDQPSLGVSECSFTQGQSDLLGDSLSMNQLRSSIDNVAKSNASVFLHGASGTGKEIVARKIHLESGRVGKLVPVNCGSISKDLAVSELFGHEKGSFTGANSRHIGHFENANKGTIFLDEITEMPMDTQVHLLRVLESSKYRRLGAKEEIVSDARVIAATNRNPEKAIKQGKLRQDLYYRLAEFPINLPPLSERGNDVLLIAEHILNKLNSQYGKNKRLSEQTKQALLTYDWPGNVRELKNILHRSYLLSDNQVNWLSVSSNEPTSADSDNAYSVSKLLGKSFWEIEKELIFATLSHHNGDKEKTAKMLGISLKTLYNRLHAYS